MAQARRTPAVLCILDGWGHREEHEGNAIRLAGPVHIDGLSATYPHLLLRASGTAVGLPDGQIGNSEVGHLALGAGRPVKQILTRIREDVDSGALGENPAVVAALNAARGRDLHLFGLLSEGGVHSHQVLAEEMVRRAARFRRDGGNLGKVWVHAFLDGRDTPPQSALGYLARLQRVLDEEETGEVASLMGRFYAMDRDGNWDRTEMAWRAMVLGEGRTAPSWEDAVREGYGRGETDEFLEPTLICPQGRPPEKGCIGAGDSLVFFNYRADRARQLTRALAFETFEAFRRPSRPEPARFTCFAPYDSHWNLPVVYEPDRPDMTLGKMVSEAGLPQFRVAETEKYAHVTYFFNGGREEVFEGEERILVPSQKIKSYADLPAMKAEEITQAVEGILGRDPQAFTVVNFANADMVGHSGDLRATIEACRVVDACVGRLAEALRERGGFMILTADHGNAEMMIDPGTGGPHTAHTTCPVPCVIVSEDVRGVRPPREAALSDVAPTFVEWLRMPVCGEMSGMSLLGHPRS